MGFHGSTHPRATGRRDVPELLVLCQIGVERARNQAGSLHVLKVPLKDARIPGLWC